MHRLNQAEAATQTAAFRAPLKHFGPTLKRWLDVLQDIQSGRFFEKVNLDAVAKICWVVACRCPSLQRLHSNI